MVWFLLISVIVLGVCAMSQNEYKSDIAARDYLLFREYIV